jgi:hypothetical protein
MFHTEIFPYAYLNIRFLCFCKYTITFFFFEGRVELGFELRALQTCTAGILPLEPHLQPDITIFTCKKKLTNDFFLYFF